MPEEEVTQFMDWVSEKILSEVSSVLTCEGQALLGQLGEAAFEQLVFPTLTKTLATIESEMHRRFD